MTKSIHHRIASSTSPSNLFFGSPDIIALDDSSLLMSFDLFGSGAPVDSGGLYNTSRVYHSADGGVTWALRATTAGMFWPSFVRGASGLYRIGMSARFRNFVISESTDDGVTWSTPTVISSASKFSQAPQAGVVKNGKLYVAVVTTTDDSFPFEGIQLWSCPVGELMTAGSWVGGTNLTKPASIYGLNEPNVVEAPDGSLRVWARVDSLDQTPRVIEYSVNETTNDLTLAKDYSFDGGNVKFQIIKDPTSGDYFCARTSKPVNDSIDRRTLLVVDRSSDLVYWRRVAILGETAPGNYDVAGYQYPSIVIDGDDLLAVIRVGELGVCDSYHNSNTIFFSRVENFRNL